METYYASHEEKIIEEIDGEGLTAEPVDVTVEVEDNDLDSLFADTEVTVTVDILAEEV